MRSARLWSPRQPEPYRAGSARGLEPPWTAAFWAAEAALLVAAPAWALSSRVLRLGRVLRILRGRSGSVQRGRVCLCLSELRLRRIFGLLVCLCWSGQALSWLRSVELCLCSARRSWRLRSSPSRFADCSGCWCRGRTAAHPAWCRVLYVHLTIRHGSVGRTWRPHPLGSALAGSWWGRRSSGSGIDPAHWPRRWCRP